MGTKAKKNLMRNTELAQAISEKVKLLFGTAFTVILARFIPFLLSNA